MVLPTVHYRWVIFRWERELSEGASKPRYTYNLPEPGGTSGREHLEKESSTDSSTWYISSSTSENRKSVFNGLSTQSSSYRR